ncbi:MAG TPA: aldehyde dehydrogenase family protein [Longimicrobiales bacterium]|nr:aldehyde dehydrogenase family protein [Longimicrobiales bacterium]
MTENTLPQVPELMERLEYGPAPEASSEVRTWIEERGPFGHFIGGTWVEPSAGERFDVHDPATGKVLTRVAQGSDDDVAAAVAAARAAFPAWSALDGHLRARYLYALARQVQRHTRFLAVLESLDNGKPIRESRDIDVPLVARHFYHHAGWAQLMGSDPDLRDQRPLGVCGQIIPWNFPLLMLAWKIAPALATGNTVLLKPAEYTPLTALRFAELVQAAGLPDGVVNIVTGDGRTGAAIVRHPDVDKIAFTGSTEVGRIIRQETAGTGKHLSLELGGKSPFVVYEDADLDSVVEGVVDAIWFNQGQVCCAGSRILVQEGVADRLVHKLRQRMEKLRVGDPLDKGVDIGAIVAPVQLERITALVEQGREEGAEVWQPSWGCPTEGWFYPPTLITNVSPAATVSQVEIFGPVVVLMTFRTPEESVQLANNTPYGLAASVWTENVNLALDIAPKIRAGTVWVNSTNLFDAASGFGGYKESGFGREGGREGLWQYLEPVWEAARAAGGGDTSRAGNATEVAGARQAGGADEPPAAGPPPAAAPPIDRTPKLYIGGRQTRPDSGYATPVVTPDGRLLGEVGTGNRKDIRDAVEAAHKAFGGWSRAAAHTRAQVIYYVAENLAARSDEFARRLAALAGASEQEGREEVELSIRRLFSYAAWADKWDGAVHHTPFRNVTLAMPEPIGVFGVVCPEERPLLGFISTVFPPIALGSTVVAVPAERAPLAATDLYQVLDTSDVPGGVVNIVTGPRDPLAETLAGHYDVDALWYFGPGAGAAAVERLAAGNMKRTWAPRAGRDWADPVQGEGTEFLRRATQVKNIWVPYGE